MEEYSEIEIPDRLKSKNDGRKKAWFIKKINKLEEELSFYKNSDTQTNGSPSNETDNETYAQGFIDCMHRFQIMNKVARQNLHKQIIANGPGAVKRLKGAKFRGITL